MSVRSTRAFLELARWENALIASLGVLFGAWWVGWGSERPIAFAVLAALPLTAAANAWNDIADISIDRRAHRSRPLPSGRLSVEAARRFAAFAALAGVLLASGADAWLGALTVAVVGLMYAYSNGLKTAGLIGNVTVALLASLPFLYGGGGAAGKPVNALVLVAIAAPLHFAREIAKDIEDAPADAASRSTLPVTAGSELATAVLVASLIVFLLLLIPYVVARPLLAVALLPAAGLVVYAGWCVVKGRRGSPLVFKIAMLCAMGAFVVVHN